MYDDPALRHAPPAGLSMVEPPPPPPRRRNGRRWLLLLAAGLAAALGWRYGVPARVEAIEIRPAPFTRTVSGPALLDALVKVEVGARIQGRIAELLAEEGDRVAAGALLVRLDTGDAGHLLAQAEAQTGAARRAVTEAEADRDAAEAALVRARADFRRKEELLPRGATTRAEFDAARSTLDQATANVERSRSAVMRARDQLSANEAGTRGTGVRLGDTTIAAPVPGVITDRLRSVGDVVAAGTPILRLVDPASIVLSARFDESVMAQIRPGQAAELRYVSYPGRVFRGTVLRIGRNVDTTTREFTVDLTTEELPPHWAIGQRAMITLATGSSPSVVTVPQDVLAPRSGQSGLWVAEGGTRAQWRPVQLGAAADGRVEVREGLQAGDVVLRRGRRLYPFMPVTPVLS